jgi:hypothetical protein
MYANRAVSAHPTTAHLTFRSERQVAGAKQVDHVQKEVARTLAGVDPTTLAKALSGAGDRVTADRYTG